MIFVIACCSRGCSHMNSVSSIRRYVRRRKGLLNAAALLVTTCLLSPGAHGQELEPRAYTNLPTGLNFLAVGYAHSQGGLSTDPSLPVTDAHLQIHTALLAYVRSLDLWGKSAKFDVIAPYSKLSGNAMLAGQAREREVSGFSDPRLRLSVNFYGAPALTVPEYAEYKRDLVIGASLQVMPPVGQYDETKVINLGSNRWAFKPDIGFSKSFLPLTLDLTFGATFFTANDNYLGGKRLEQKPIYSTQGNISYDFGSGIWAALGATYYMGGRTSLNGVARDDSLGNSRVGLTVSAPLNRYYSVKFNASTGISTRTGTNFDTLGLVLQYRWGAGL